MKSDPPTLEGLQAEIVALGAEFGRLARKLEEHVLEAKKQAAKLDAHMRRADDHVRRLEWMERVKQKLEDAAEQVHRLATFYHRLDERINTAAELLGVDPAKIDEIISGPRQDHPAGESPKPAGKSPAPRRKDKP